MHILSEVVLDIMGPVPVINLHPALPSAFDGANAIKRAHEAWKRGGITRSGCMVHQVVNQEMFTRIIHLPNPIHQPPQRPILLCIRINKRNQPYPSSHIQPKRLFPPPLRRRRCRVSVRQRVRGYLLEASAMQKKRRERGGYLRNKIILGMNEYTPPRGLSCCC